MASILPLGSGKLMVSSCMYLSTTPLITNAEEYSHIAVVIKKEPNILEASFEITVFSKWGADGEYIHLIDAVPDPYGKIREFWTDRRTS